MFRQATCSAVRSAVGVQRACVSVSAPQSAAAMQDPIQEVFVKKIKEYAQKQKQTGEKLVYATDETKKNLEAELALAGRVYKITNEADAQKFPALNFEEVKLDPINMEDRVQEKK